jgi:hypothetical protein
MRIHTMRTKVACATLPVSTQVELTQALLGLLSEEATYNALDAQLKENLSLVKAAEVRLRQRSRRSRWIGE